MTEPRTITLTETQDMVSIHRLAHAIWLPTYQKILSSAQIEYMLEAIYSLPALEKQVQEGQVFLLVSSNSRPVGFAAYSLLVPEEKVYKLNKIYLHPDVQGQGFGQLLLEEVITRIAALGGETLELNVHRQNPAQHFYLKNGFQIHQVADIPFGPFTLNDYIMRRPLP
ncbi:MAG: GNAT family N-acetyltransferase [Rufibacter sp.]